MTLNAVEEELKNDIINEDIARRFLGYREFRRLYKNGDHRGYVPGWLDENMAELDGPLPKFSTCMSAAEILVGVLRSENYSVDISMGLVGVRCHLRKSDGTTTISSDAEPTIARAVCAAVLKSIDFNSGDQDCDTTAVKISATIWVPETILEYHGRKEKPENTGITFVKVGVLGE